MHSRGLPAGGALALVVAGALFASPPVSRAQPEDSVPGSASSARATTLDRVLRRGRLGIRYSCMRECAPVMRLRVGGVPIASFDPPGGPTAGDRAASFVFRAAERRIIRGQIHHGAARFRLAAVFTARTPGRDVRSLRFVLRR